MTRIKIKKRAITLATTVTVEVADEVEKLATEAGLTISSWIMLAILKKIKENGNQEVSK